MFASIAVGEEGMREFFTRIYMNRYDNPANNTASRVLMVEDGDTEGPLISNVRVQEYEGDGDGIIGANEKISISWDLWDASGIAAVRLELNGVDIPLTGDYFAIFGPFAPGRYVYTITATDADSSPETSHYHGEFTVVTPPEIGISYGTKAIAREQSLPMHIGFIHLPDGSGQTTFIVRNMGEQTLLLEDITPPSGFAVATPGVSTIQPGGTGFFSLIAETAEPGPFEGVVSVRSNDAGGDYSFTVGGHVLPPNSAVMLIGAEYANGVRTNLEFGETEPHIGFDELSHEATNLTAFLVKHSLPGGVPMARDFRPIPADGTTRWRLEVGAPSLPQGRSVHPDGVASPETRAERSETGHPAGGSEAANLNLVEEEAEIRLRRETSYTLTWNVGAADPGREVWLQRLDAFERPVGFPVDMKARNELPGVVPGTAFEIVYGALRAFEIPLERGWNAVGTPLLTLAPFGDLLPTGRTGGGAVSAWRRETGGQTRLGGADAFRPEIGHQILCLAESATLTVTGLPPDGMLLLEPGWNLVSPVMRIELPAAGRDELPGPAWRLLPGSRGYVPTRVLEPGTAYWLHLDGDVPAWRP